MIIWSGLGFLVPLIGIMSYLAVSAVAGAGGSEPPAWTPAVAYFVAGALVTPLGLYLKNRPQRVLVDKEPNEEVRVGRADSLFFIPVLYWGPILAAIGLYRLIAG